MKYLLLLPALLCLTADSQGQLVSAILAFVFIISSVIAKSKTYNIMALLMLMSASIHYFLTSVIIDPAWWPVVYSLIDVVMLTLILALGDKHRIYQAVALSMLITLHFFVACDIVMGTSLVIVWYYPAIMVIMMAQAMGSGGDVVRRYALDAVDYIRHKCRVHALHHRKGNL